MSVPEDRRRIATRLVVLQVGTVVVFAVLAMSFWFLQIVQHQKYFEMAENNNQRTLALRAPRGVLFDRNGKVLVDNRLSFTISIVRERTKDITHTISLLSEVAGLDPARVKQIVDRHRGEPTYRPIVVVEDASLAQVAAISARRLAFELPDVRVDEVPTRKYPEIAAHLFGYVGEASDQQVSQDTTLKSGDIVGQQGIEKIYNADLKGQDGAKVVVVNSLGREIRTLDEQRPTEGKRLQLTIDYDVQKAAEDAFDTVWRGGLTNAGAAVVLDPNSGEVLAFTSRPAFDPNAFAAGIDKASWASLTGDEQRPLNNRAIQGRYSPGSTFKMAVGLAGLEEGVITPDFKVHCSGGATFYGRYFKCWRKGGHGTVDLRHAIEQSCDVYFYTVANLLGVDRINKWATLLGLGVKSGIDLPNEVTGLVPSTEWKRLHTKEKKWFAGETISVGIGQGAVSVTPVSMAVYMATIANGGTRITPHLVKATQEGTGPWKPVPTPAPQSRFEIDADKLQAIKDGMWMVVNAAGTGGRARIGGHDVAGKTGTAQVISNTGRAASRSSKDLRDNGWFAFFAPRDKPEIAGIVFLEHGMHGPNAASVAHHILDTYFAKKDGRPLPPPPTIEMMRLDFADPAGGGHRPQLPPAPPAPEQPAPAETGKVAVVATTPAAVAR